MSNKIHKIKYQWDAYSDQPYPIHDQRKKWAIYWSGKWGIIKTIFAATIIPFVYLRSTNRFNDKIKRTNTENTIGLSINLEKQLLDKQVLNAGETLDIISKLNLKRLSMRIPLNDSDNLEAYINFINVFKAYQLVIVILQDETHIDDSALFRSKLRWIFTQLSHLDAYYQIGNAVNRRKWGFYSQDHYFHFFKIAYELKISEFPAVKLLGGAVIDFEMPDYCRSLINFFSIKYDAFSSLLYVDRRGAPENKQLGLNLLGKIDFIHRLLENSNKIAQQPLPKEAKKFWITEVNWPLQGTEPFAPAVGKVMVDEKKQADYLTRYFLLVLASGKVTACFMHQLIAPGYGLIDNRHQNIRYRPAFYAFKTLCHWFNNSEIKSLQQDGDFYSVVAIIGNKSTEAYICALWTNDTIKTIELHSSCHKIVSQSGEEIPLNKNLQISGSVSYLLGHSPSLYTLLE